MFKDVIIYKHRKEKRIAYNVAGVERKENPMTTVYIPIYTNHWDVITDDGDLLKPLYKSTNEYGYSVCKCKPEGHIGFYGYIYNSCRVYTNKEAAWNYIHKNYGAIREEDYFFGKEFR